MLMSLVHINSVVVLLQHLVTLVIQAITVWTGLLAIAVNLVIVEIVQAVILVLAVGLVIAVAGLAVILV